jgi:hypothetical protein
MPIVCELLRHVGDQLAPVDHAGFGGESAEPEVFGNRQFGDKLQFLVNDDHASVESIAD